MQNKSTLTVGEDPQTGELYLDLPDDLIENMGWSVGDTLTWKDNGDGSWSLQKLDASTMEKTKPIL